MGSTLNGPTHPTSKKGGGFHGGHHKVVPRCFCKAEILWEPTLGKLVALTTNGIKHTAERCGTEVKAKK